jgi:hypothetical protein
MCKFQQMDLHAQPSYLHHALHFHDLILVSRGKTEEDSSAQRLHGTGRCVQADTRLEKKELQTAQRAANSACLQEEKEEEGCRRGVTWCAQEEGF